MTPQFKDWLKTSTRRQLLVEVSVNSGGEETVRYLSTSGYVTGPADTPPNTVYLGRIVDSLSFTQSLSIEGGGSVSYGSLVVDNIDGELDGWLDDVWEGREVRAYMGDPSWLSKSDGLNPADPIVEYTYSEWSAMVEVTTLADSRVYSNWSGWMSATTEVDATPPAAPEFELIFVGVMRGISAGRSVLRFDFQDKLALLDKPISTAKVAVGEANEDAPYPVALGECFNVTPLQVVSTGNPIYRVNVSGCEAIIEARDNGFPVPITTANQNATFTLQFNRFGEITCDVQGTKVGPDYRRDVGGLVEWLATTIGEEPPLTAADIDAAALSAFRAACPQAVGYYGTGLDSRLGVSLELASSVGATVTFDRLGKMKLVRLAMGTPTRTITPDNMVDGTFEPVLMPPVAGEVVLQGGRNWSVQDKANLAASLIPTQVEVLSGEYHEKQAKNSGIMALYKQKEGVDPLSTLLVNDAELLAEAQRRRALWGTQRSVFRFQGYPELFDIELGQMVTVFHPLLNMESGKTGIIALVEYDLISAMVSLEVLV